MSFVSYAQNFEDVMLWRALKHIKKGFYVDVGAQHPVIDSVSKAFYERGWRGIHIEPVPQYAELLRQVRPDETVFQVALGDTEGTLELNVIPDTGLSTGVEGYAQRHKVGGGYESCRIQVPVLTLKSALGSLSGKDIHWLKIDVEGFEGKVLKGWDSQTIRPWIIVVEATIPSSPETNYASWDPILTAAAYQFVYFDGLNRFYVSKEHAELAEAFSCPPNVFDKVQLSGLASSDFCRGLIALHQAAEKELVSRAENLVAEVNAATEGTTRLQAHGEWLQSEWDAAKQRVEELRRNIGRLEGDLDSEHQRALQLLADLEAAREYESQSQTRAQWLENEWDGAKAKMDELNWELQSLYASKSWRITWPLRKTMKTLKWILSVATGMVRWALPMPKHIAKPLVVWGIRKSLSNPRLKARTLHVLSRCPQLKQQLRQFAIRSGLVTDSTVPSPDHLINPNSQPPGLRLENSVATASLPNMPEGSMKTLSPRAARIYSDLKRALDATKR